MTAIKWKHNTAESQSFQLWIIKNENVSAKHPELHTLSVFPKTGREWAILEAEDVPCKSMHLMLASVNWHGSVVLIVLICK